MSNQYVIASTVVLLSVLFAALMPLQYIALIEILPVRVIVALASAAIISTCVMMIFIARTPLSAEVNLQRAQRSVTILLGVLITFAIYPIPKIEIQHDIVSVKYIVTDSFRITETGLVHLYWTSLIFIFLCVFLNIVNDLFKR